MKKNKNKTLVISLKYKKENKTQGKDTILPRGKVA